MDLYCVAVRQYALCGARRSFAGPVLFKSLTRKRHIAECRSDVADDKIREIPPRLIDRLGLKWPPMPIEFGKNYFRLRCCYSINIIVEECGSAGDGRWLGFQQLHRKVILHSQRLSCCIIGCNPLWITFSLARRHSNPCHQLIFYRISTLVGGTRLSACTPMSFDRSNDRIIHLPPCRRRGCFFFFFFLPALRDLKVSRNFGTCAPKIWRSAGANSVLEPSSRCRV